MKDETFCFGQRGGKNLVTMASEFVARADFEAVESCQDVEFRQGDAAKPVDPDRVPQGDQVEPPAAPRPGSTA